MVSRENLIILERYKLLKKIGEGSFGEVYLAMDIKMEQFVAVKLESLDSKTPRLIFEAQVIKELSGCQGVPRHKAHGRMRSQNIHYMITEFLGPTLEDIFDICGRQFSLKTTCMLFY
jgi:casein kinase 1 alpha